MKKFILLLDGMMGAGKSTTSRLLSNRLPRTATLGMDKIKKYISDFERGKRDNTIARKVIVEMTRKFLDLNISVVIEQPILDEETFIYEEMASSFSVPCYKFSLFTTPKTAFERVVERQTDSKNKNPEERVHRNINLYKSRSELGFVNINTTSMKPEEVVEKILANIQN